MVFDVQYWLTIATFIFGFSGFYFVLGCIFDEERKKSMSVRDRIYKGAYAFLVCASAFLVIDTSEANSKFQKILKSYRVLVLVMCFCGMMNYYIYNAGLISFLMVLGSKHQSPNSEFGRSVLSSRIQADVC